MHFVGGVSWICHIVDDCMSLICVTTMVWKSWWRQTEWDEISYYESTLKFPKTLAFCTVVYVKVKGNFIKFLKNASSRGAYARARAHTHTLVIHSCQLEYLSIRRLCNTAGKQSVYNMWKSHRLINYTNERIYDPVHCNVCFVLVLSTFNFPRRS